jgi:hypothetical protein
MENKSAFTNHRHNGVYLQFPNGNAISTIWGVGTYSDNHNKSFNDYSKLIESGSMAVEIMPITKNIRLLKRIFRKCKQTMNDTVIGWVDITTWLWIINQLANDKEIISTPINNEINK